MASHLNQSPYTDLQALCSWPLITSFATTQFQPHSYPWRCLAWPYCVCSGFYLQDLSPRYWLKFYLLKEVFTDQDKSTPRSMPQSSYPGFFFIFRVYYHEISMFLLIISLLILVSVSTQKTKVLSKYLLTEFDDQSFYLGLSKIIFFLGSEIINSVQRYITLESCLSFWSLTSGKNIGSQSVFASRKFLLSFQT